MFRWCHVENCTASHPTSGSRSLARVLLSVRLPTANHSLALNLPRRWYTPEFQNASSTYGEDEPHLLPPTLIRVCREENRHFWQPGLLGCHRWLWFFGGGTQPLPTANADDTPRVGSPVAHENLTVYFVHGSDTVASAKILSLSEALDRNLAVVHETSDVNMLAVENKSDEYELFIQSGDIVKGGKQDRMVQLDMLLPPKSGVVPLPAHCVEQGRWTGRGSEDSKAFKSSNNCAVGNDIKIANFSGQQPAVWKKVEQQQAKLNESFKGSANVQAAASPTSFQLSLESPDLQRGRRIRSRSERPRAKNARTSSAWCSR